MDATVVVYGLVPITLCSHYLVLIIKVIGDGVMVIKYVCYECMCLDSESMVLMNPENL